MNLIGVIFPFCPHPSALSQIKWRGSRFVDFQIQDRSFKYNYIEVSVDVIMLDDVSAPPECSDFSPPVTVMLMIFLCLEGLLFLTFTAVMFGTQVHSICNDETVRRLI